MTPCTKLDPRVRASCTCVDCSRDRSRRVDRRGRNVANLMKRGAAIAVGLMGMAEAIRERT